MTIKELIEALRMHDDSLEVVLNLYGDDAQKVIDGVSACEFAEETVVVIR
jgi:hypothetical protein